jgi:hypothetical protein
MYIDSSSTMLYAGAPEREPACEYSYPLLGPSSASCTGAYSYDGSCWYCGWGGYVDDR